MTEPSAPDELKQFLLTHVEDLAELEILAWLHRSSEGTWAGESDLSVAMPFPPDTTAAALERLVGRGLVARSHEKPGQICYDAPDAEFRGLLRRTIDEYRASPVQFMALMTAISLERVRTAALRTFAECFRLEGPKKNG
jgi:hypothetical protein